MIEKGVYSRLSTDSTLTAIVGTKIFAGRIEQEVSPPFVMFWRVSGSRPDSLTGHNGMTRANIQVDCFATTYGQIKAINDAVRLRLDGFKGTMGTEEAKACRMTGEREYYDQEAELFISSLDFSIWYVETTS